MRPILLLAGLLFVFSSLYPQDSASTLSKTSNNAIAFYSKFIGENSALYNGAEYVAYDFHIQGHPYLEFNTMQTGSVNYCGILFDKIQIAYDIVREEVITTRFGDNVRIRLVNEKLDSFWVANHFFVRLTQDTTNQLVISTGFYERLYDGKIKMFAKRKKKILESANTYEGDKLWFAQVDQYFVKKNNNYYAVQNKSELLRLFESNSKDIRKYLRKNKLIFKKQPENTILYAIKYYDQLKS